MQHTTLKPQPKQTYANKHYVMIWIFTYLKTKTIPMEELLKVHRELLLNKPKTYSHAFSLFLPPNLQSVNAKFSHKTDDFKQKKKNIDKCKQVFFKCLHMLHDKYIRAEIIWTWTRKAANWRLYSSYSRFRYQPLQNHHYKSTVNKMM